MGRLLRGQVGLRFSPATDVEVDEALRPTTRVSFSAAEPAAVVGMLRAGAFPRERPTA
jgi:hypothetical protein